MRRCNTYTIHNNIMLEMTKELNVDIIELETRCNATVMKSKLLFKNILQFFIYIYLLQIALQLQLTTRKRMQQGQVVLGKVLLHTQSL